MAGKIRNSTGLKLIALLLFAVVPGIVSAQDDDGLIKDKTSNFSYVVTVQTKGISTIPNLTLGKPAAIFDMKLGRKLTFEPQFRFALSGKPWAMVFWWRYNPTISKNLRLIFSTNYSLSYKTITVSSSAGEPQDIIRTTRYLVGTLEPIYKVNNYIDIGTYIFYNYGIEKFIARNTWMFSFRPGFSIPVTKNITAKINPEIYYLKIDKTDGVYINARFSVTKKNFPLAITGLVNQPLNSDIPSEYDFLWNIGLSYTFNRKYTETN
jgi:hypothetical protein